MGCVVCAHAALAPPASDLHAARAVLRRATQEAGRHEGVLQAVINPSDEALWNLMTACSNQGEPGVWRLGARG